MMFIAYYRVSTQKQGQSGLGLDAQRVMIQMHAETGVLAEYTEIETGKIAERPQLQAALAHCKSVGATLIIAKLDRLARNVHFVSGLMESGVPFVAADMPTANRFTLHIMAAVAEHEAAMISDRTKAALAAAKARGVKLGGYRGRIANAEVGRVSSMRRRSVRAEGHRSLVHGAIEGIKASGATSLQQIAAALNAQGHRAPRGGGWTPTQVRRVTAA